jgi:DNA helicase-2/ATP-dependent DNA helicase PcrA
LVSLVAGRFPSQSRRDKLPIPEALIKESLTGLDENEEHIQEERRLFYVGATRAKEKLYLTASTFYGTGKRRSKGSIFLHEILDRDVTEDLKHPIKLTDSEGLSLDFVNSNEDMNQPLLNIKNERFSYSQIDVYMQCPLKYYYMYVLKIPPKPNAALSFGITVHNALRDFYTLLKQCQEGLGFNDIPSEKDLLDAFEKHWVSFGYQGKKHEQQRKEVGREMMSNFYSKIFDEKSRPYMLEEKFTGHIGENLFVGKIDRVDVVDMDSEIPIVDIIDYKTGHVKSDSEIKSDLQLPLYVLFAQMAYGFKVRKAKYIFVEHGIEKEVDISEKRIEKAKEKLVSVIEKFSR